LKDDRIYVEHVLECITKINRFAGADFQEFLSDEKTQDAVYRNLQMLAESATRISQSTQASFPEVPWRRLAGFRNVIVHDYFGIDTAEVILVLRDEMPKLELHMRGILDRLNQEK
jgi:uncharacterized protein with HEPN domain